MQRSPLARDRFALYEAAVQSPDYDLDFIENVYRARHARKPVRLREDFCGTGRLALEWARRHPRHTALALDLDAPTLAWGRRQHLARAPRAVTRRVVLERRDVRSVTRPAADVIVALNFSWWIFRERRELLRYFRAAHASLARGGMLIMNTYGGTAVLETQSERRRIAPSQGPDGLRMPGFVYEWEQAFFNPVDHHVRCHIHFKFHDGSRMRRAFTYEWRMWMLPETQDALREAGFRDVQVWHEGWNHRLHEPSDVFERRTQFENQLGWLAYVIAWK
jgi:cyclopropane fatty-acyl-phospholipid synthase-like methyltransferase